MDEDEEDDEDEPARAGARSRRALRSLCAESPAGWPGSTSGSSARGSLPAIDVITTLVESARQGLRAALPSEALAHDVVTLCEVLLRVEAQHVAFRRMLGAGNLGDECCSGLPEPGVDLVTGAGRRVSGWAPVPAAGSGGGGGGGGSGSNSGGSGSEGSEPKGGEAVALSMPRPAALVHVGALVPLRCGHNGNYNEGERGRFVQELVRLGWYDESTSSKEAPRE